MAKKRVAICALRLVDPQVKRVLSMQRWQYAQALSRLLLDMGYAVAWYQLGDGWHSEIMPGVPLVGSLPEESQLFTWPKASIEFWEKAGAADFAIYFDLLLAYPQVHEYSLGIAHGIEWNDPLLESRLNSEREREEWKRRLWMSFCGPRRIVAVDSGVIHWATATWPGLYNQFVHIPNFAFKIHDDTTISGATTSEMTGDTTAADRVDEDQILRIVFWDVLSPQSGIAQTLEAVGAVLSRYPNVELVIAGRGSPAVDQYVSRWAQEHEQVRYHPEGVSPERLKGAILLIPAKWNVGPSFVCLQGMASGAAIVVGQTSGLTDLVIHDHNGWIIRPSAPSIYDALVALIENPIERRRMGQNAREVARAFSHDVWRNRWKRLIEDEFEGRSAR